jgi:hypothetical protein
LLVVGYWFTKDGKLHREKITRNQERATRHWFLTPNFALHYVECGAA